jgi:type III restriction enzyme
MNGFSTTTRIASLSCWTRGRRHERELGVGNRLLGAENRLRANAREIRERNDIEVPDASAQLEAWELFDVPANQTRRCPHFSVEMETGTGKTYVYLRSSSSCRGATDFPSSSLWCPALPSVKACSKTWR